MTRKELLEERQNLDVNDNMKIFDCAKTFAYKTIREIHSVSNIGQQAGRILVKDYELWLEFYANKEKAREGKVQ